MPYIQKCSKCGKCSTCKFSTKTMWTVKCTLNPFQCLSEGKYLLYKPKD